MKALDRHSELTPLGKILARLPLEPRMGRMIIFGCIFSCGDALCTIAASTTYSEPFVTAPDQRRLSYVHKNLAGDRCSDHVALLQAFQLWQRARHHGEMAELQLCESKQLAINTLRMTFEAKRQLCDILINADFPEECLTPQQYTVRGPDEHLDVVLCLLVMGLFPNVCYHKNKRQVFTTDLKPALVHKSSVNCSNLAGHFPSPFFVFGEKVNTDNTQSNADLSL